MEEQERPSINEVLPPEIIYRILCASDPIVNVIELFVCHEWHDLLVSTSKKTLVVPPFLHLVAQRGWTAVFQWAKERGAPLWPWPKLVNAPDETQGITKSFFSTFTPNNSGYQEFYQLMLHEMQTGT